MSGQKEFIRISAGSISTMNEMMINDNTGQRFNPYYVETLRNFQGYFTIVLEELLCTLIGKDGWALQFDRKDTILVKFLVKVYLDNVNQFSMVKSIIEENIKKDFELEFAHFGTVNDYLANQ